MPAVYGLWRAAGSSAIGLPPRAGATARRLWQDPGPVAEESQAAVEGSVSRVVFSSPEKDWMVLRVQPSGNAAEVVVVGALHDVREGEQVKLWGQWVQDGRFGQQLKVSRYRVVLPATVAGIERYLSSGQIPGLGPKTARLLVARFGDQTLEVIDKHPRRLALVKGIGKKKLAQIQKSWRETVGVRDVMLFLTGELALSASMARKIFKEYGMEAPTRIRANPYELAQHVWGVGFLKADHIARKIGLDQRDPQRLRAGLVHALAVGRSEGHVCLPRETLLTEAAKLLGVDDSDLFEELDALAELVRVRIEQPDDLVYLPDLYTAERRAAENLIRLADYELLTVPREQLHLLVMQAQSKLGVQLAPRQYDAVVGALQNTVSVITGGPGTGKTTIVRAVVEALEALGKTVALCAPTGRAAKRLGESTGREAKTVHRLLEWAPGEAGFTRDEDTPLAVDAVVVDEVSMVDIRLLDAILRAMPTGSQLVLVGDVDQLPSVGPGTVLTDIIESGAVLVSRLGQIFRQGVGSEITVAAHRILAGEIPESPPSGAKDADFYFIEKDDPEDIVAIMRALVAERIPKRFGLQPKEDVQVLTPMHRDR